MPNARAQYGLNLRCLVIVVCWGMFTSAGDVEAQNAGGVGVRQAVGGVFVDLDGTLQNEVVADLGDAGRFAAEAHGPDARDLARLNPLRKVSLRRLEAAAQAAIELNKPLPAEVRFLAGLQSIRFVVVDREHHDILLVGPAEGWEVDRRGNVVGLTTGHAVMELDDLLVAWRTVRGGGPDAITCSIDPTAQGIAQLRAYVATLKSADQISLRRVEEELGRQSITVTGVPESSHFARVLVAADYRMKRLGMRLDPSPIPGLPSYVEMLHTSGSGVQSMTPRWWMVPQYDTLRTDAEGLAFELPTGTIRIMTEETLFNKDGSAQHSGKTSGAAEQWAAIFTKKFEKLAVKEPVFGQVRNCIELAIVAALIERHQLTQKAGHPFAILTDKARIPAGDFPAAKTTASYANMTKRGSQIVVTASGGIEIHPLQQVGQIEQSSALKTAVEQAAPPAETKNWWWN